MNKLTKLTFLGDVMCKAEMLDAYKIDGKYNFFSIFAKLKPFLEDSDYVFANLETPISLNNADLSKAQYSFNSPYEFAEAVYSAGIDFVSTANNHCLDRGINGLKSTVASLNKIGIKHTGVFADRKSKKPLIITVNQLKIGVIAYTYGTNAFANHNYLSCKEKFHVNLFQNQELSNFIDRWCYYHRTNLFARVWNKISEIRTKGQISGEVYERRENDYFCRRNIKKDVRFLKNKGVDLIIMYMHAGGQYNDNPTEYCKSLTDWLLKLGVNVVVGSHEHVVHGGKYNEKCSNKLATYSLGNSVGIAGIYEAPFDKFSEYSIAWHVYVNNEGVISKTSFSILKTLPVEGNRIEVVPCYQLLNNPSFDNTSKQSLLKDLKIIYNKFCGKNITEKDLCNFEEHELN